MSKFSRNFVSQINFLKQVSPNYSIILHSFSHLILSITRNRWSTALLQLLNFICLSEFGRFTAFSLPASFFAKISVFAKVFAITFVILVTFRKLLSLTAETNFREIFANIRKRKFSFQPYLCRILSLSV
jgi:hypothetical protein